VCAFSVNFDSVGDVGYSPAIDYLAHRQLFRGYNEFKFTISVWPGSIPDCRLAGVLHFSVHGQ
jgi:hypothetical protein